MASWSELLAEFQTQNDPDWLDKKLKERLVAISEHRGDAAVIFYASAFLQKVVDNVSIIREDINGFMNALYEAPTDKGLVLILHTPGGDPNAVESIVEYLHSKFTRIAVIVPYLAMSGGAMISLASDLLVLGKQSQLGPIDPQFVIGNKTHSARAIQEGFSKAKEDIENDTKLAHLWAPILQNMGPSLVLEADKALSYSKELVANWLHTRMLKNISNENERRQKAGTIAAYFNAEETSNLMRIFARCSDGSTPLRSADSTGCATASGAVARARCHHAKRLNPRLSPPSGRFWSWCSCRSPARNSPLSSASGSPRVGSPHTTAPLQTG